MRHWIGGAILAAIGAFAQAAEPVRIEVTVPAVEDPRLAEAVGAFSQLEDGAIVALQVGVDLGAEVFASALCAAGDWREISSCGFGPVEDVRRLDLPLRDNHLIVEIEPGDPNLHAANAVFCEYAPENLAGATGNPERLTVRGCYLAMSFSIPTARHLLLRPLPAAACGIGE